MTVIQFHFNVPDRLAYACRLLRKAVRMMPGISVVGSADVLDRLNRQMWTFEAGEFLPHILLRPNELPSDRLRPTPIWLVSAPEQSPADHAVLVNLSNSPVQTLSRYQRLVEIVSIDPDDRNLARQRWRHYTSQGYVIEKFEVPA